jgi:rod shape-determining protein MreD
MTRTGPGKGFVFVSLLLALALTVLPLPRWGELLRPEWVALALGYWCLHQPQRVSIGTAFLLGIVLDVLKGALLGEHALALVLFAFLLARFHLQVRVFPIWQQTATVAATLLVYHFVLFWIEGTTGQTTPFWMRLPGLLTTALLWPWVVESMRAARGRRELT